MDQNEELLELSGSVSSVIYKNEENGYTVLRLLDGSGETVTVVGCFPYASVGESMIISGRWTTHNVHGRQFKAEFAQRGIHSYTISAHVSGDLIKFYGVAGTGFFRYYYPTDDGESKFGDEQRNGAAHHYPFDATELQHSVDTLAEAVGLKVYGGDCIVDETGHFYVIDFNDWPSFSRCREEAATAIASLI